MSLFYFYVPSLVKTKRVYTTYMFRDFFQKGQKKKRILLFFKEIIRSKEKEQSAWLQQIEASYDPN